MGIIEWVRVLPAAVLIAADDRAFLYRVQGPGDPFAYPMQGPGSAATTRLLLDGAIGMLQREYIRRPPPAPLTVEGYVSRLVGYWWETLHNPQLQYRFAERLKEVGRHELADLTRRSAEAEESHWELALQDLEALGYARDLVPTMEVPARSITLTEYFAACIEGPSPTSAFGYVYAFERIAAAITAEYIEGIDALLYPVEATRCLRWHSGVGEDADHAAGWIEPIASMPAEDRARIVVTAYETASIVFAVEPDGTKEPAFAGSSQVRAERGRSRGED